MHMIERKTKVLEGCSPDNLPFKQLIEASEPVILKGLVKDWELVKIGQQSDSDAIAYLKSFYNGKTVGTFFGSPEINGRFFYTEDFSGLNFETRRAGLDQVLDEIAQHFGSRYPPARYVSSTTIDACLPGLRKNNDLIFNDQMFDNITPLASIWIGNPSLVSCHYDAPNNIACCVVGTRKFTLFPPEQIQNLYPGPLEPTPGGQAISMVDFKQPDFNKYPRFKKAIAAGQVAELSPGDALFYPSMWWHQVEALSAFNVLINYWWNTSPKFMGTPMNVLKHALLSLRDRPAHEKEAWKHIFNYYIFGSTEQACEHLPQHARGELNPIDELQARKLRALLLNVLNR